MSIYDGPERRVAERRVCDVPIAHPDRRRASRRQACAIAVATTACLAASVPAHAQIYSWRDANGNLVLSDRALNAEATTYAVPSAPEVRVTRPAPPADRILPYDRLISEHAASQGIRADLVRAVIQVESNFNPLARSSKGALGLMQLMPATAAALGVSNPFNAVENIRAGVAYLRQLLDRYNNNEELALAAYNAGPTAVDRHGAKVPPYRETRQYVNRILTKTGGSVRASAVIYKTIEMVEGRPVPRFSETKPANGPYEIVAR
jgi:soluble lytic murein transglycosylase-like protein